MRNIDMLDAGMKCAFLAVATSGYENYIDPYVYFIDRHYPGSGKIFVTTDKKGDRKAGDRITITEPTWPNSAFHAQSLRWLVHRPLFDKFDYIFIGDVDMLYSATPHIFNTLRDVCDEFGYSNTDQVDDPWTRGHRCTGLQCVKPKIYYHKTAKARCRHWYQIVNGKLDQYYNNATECLGHDNQTLIRIILQDSGLGNPKTPFQYYGIHLGHSRVPGRWESLLRIDKETISQVKTNRAILESDEFQRTLTDQAKADVDLLMQAAYETGCWDPLEK